MNDLITLPTAPLGAGVLASPPEPPLETILNGSGRAFMGVFAPSGDHPDPFALRDGITAAAAFLDRCGAQAAALRQAAEPVSVDEIGRQIGAFVTAWPNTSKADLAGYGAQLAVDVIERRPCHHALRSALRHLRQTSRFLPSIAEVLEALDSAQARVRNTTWHIERLPAELDRARAKLAAADRRRPTPDQEHAAP